MTLTYQAPTEADFAYVEITRFGGNTLAAAGTLVYRGQATRVIDQPLQNDIPYRYVVATLDRAGNRSSGLGSSVLPKSHGLVRPKDGARLSAASSFVWRTVRHADYYNFQLYRGPRKILSRWPGQTRFALPHAWTFNGLHYTLGPGVYRWYVWPGFGPHKLQRYGRLLGWSSVVVN